MTSRRIIASLPFLITTSICANSNPPLDNDGALYAFVQGGYASGIGMIVNSPYTHKSSGFARAAGLGESSSVTPYFRYAIEASYGNYGKEKWSGGTGSSSTSAKTYQFSHIGWTLLASAEWLGGYHSAFKLKGGVSSMNAEKEATSPDAKSSNRKLIPAADAGISIQIASGVHANFDYLRFFGKKVPPDSNETVIPSSLGVYLLGISYAI